MAKLPTPKGRRLSIAWNPALKVGRDDRSQQVAHDLNATDLNSQLNRSAFSAKGPDPQLPSGMTGSAALWGTTERVQ